MGPGEGKKPLGLHFLHRGRPLDVFIAGMRNLAARNLARYKRPLQFHAKPLAKLAVVGQRAPHPRNRSFEFNALFNTVVHFGQPPGCILTQAIPDMQLYGCTLYYTASRRDIDQESAGSRKQNGGGLRPSFAAFGGGKTNEVSGGGCAAPGDRDGGGPRIRREHPS